MFVKQKLTFGVKQAVTMILTSLLSLAGSLRGQEKAPRATWRARFAFVSISGDLLRFFSQKIFSFGQIMINP